MYELSFIAWINALCYMSSILFLIIDNHVNYFQESHKELFPIKQ